MARKSGYRLSEKIMLKQKARAGCRSNHNSSCSGIEAPLLGNHGPVVAGTSLEAAVYAMEELEETAKLVLLTRSPPVGRLGPDQIQDLKSGFNLK
jgi:ribulose-5-phosphate 4-epimerase/fuculose-1-phosphate aldolase